MGLAVIVGSSFQKLEGLPRRVAAGLGMVLSLLLPRERTRLAGLTVLMAFAGLMEVCSVVSVIPFLSVASRPEIIQESDTLRWWYEWLQFESSRSFLVFGGGVVVGVILLTNGLQARRRTAL